MTPIPWLVLAAGLTVLAAGRLLVGRDRWGNTLLTLGVALFWGWTAGWAWSLPCVAVGALIWWVPGPPHATRREALARYWQRVALLTAAGLPPLRALEDALEPDPAGAMLLELVRHVASGDRDGVERFVERWPYPEAQAIAENVRAAWDHGLDPEQAHRRSLEMIRSLAQEQRLAQATRPLWTAGLPGILLLNVVLLFLVPLGTSLIRGWVSL